MTSPIPVNLAVEDPLSAAVVRKLLSTCGGPWAVGTVYSRGGVGYLKRTIRGFNQAARRMPFVVLADLDRADCAPIVIAEWLPHGRTHNLILRFAVREVEAWVLADALSFGRFLGVNHTLITSDVEQLDDPKRELVRLAAQSKRSDIAADIVPRKGSTAVVGRNYNARLMKFVTKSWSPAAARGNSNSLNRAMSALEHFSPSWPI
jgi:hypothetical protein